MRAREFMNLDENAEDELTLYNGTIRSNISAIKLRGLVARAGAMVSHFYGSDDEELEPLVFAADIRGLKGCVAAMGRLIAETMGTRTGAYSEEAIRKYGALCVIEADPEDFTHHHRDDDPTADYEDHPIQSEPGDYYSRYDVQVDRVIVGDDLIGFLKQHGYSFTV